MVACLSLCWKPRKFGLTEKPGGGARPMREAGGNTGSAARPGGTASRRVAAMTARAAGPQTFFNRSHGRIVTSRARVNGPYRVAKGGKIEAARGRGANRAISAAACLAGKKTLSYMGL